MKIFVTVLGFLTGTVIYIHFFEADAIRAFATFVTMTIGYLFGKAQKG